MSTENNKMQEELKKNFQESPEYAIVHVDDEAPLRSIFADHISSLGIKIFSIDSAEKALDFITKNSNYICLIISDIKMAKMDGFQFREALMKICPTIPFAIASAYVDREMALQGVEKKIVAFLSKPYEFQTIVELLHKEALPKLNSLKEEFELRSSFISDSESLVEEAEEILLELENQGQDSESLNRLYGIMHTLKGASAFFDPKDLHKFVHAYEDILKKLQRNELKLDPAISSVLFRGFDTIKKLYNEFRSGAFENRNFDELLKTLNLDAAQSEIANNSGTQSSNASPDSKSSTTKTTDVQAADVIHAQKKAGNEDIKVSVKLLDEFMQLSGEVTVIRNMLNKCVSAIEKRFAGDRDVGMLSELLSELHKINSGVQNKMTEIRKVPLKSVMKILPRAIRDVAKSLSKKIDLELIGEELRVDTSIAEVLNNSLLHIIKNSIDHGIESTEKRIALGKNSVGKITVSATIRNEKVFVTITDDGQGLNIEAIKAKCLKNATHTKEQLDSMLESELFALIFSAGFSTAQQVTEISGRGIGMSMVKDSVDAIGGRINIHSTTGKGACFELELPIPKSVLIANCLGVQIANRKFSLIQDDILRVFQFNSQQISENIKSVEKSEFIIFENELIPIANLNEILLLKEQGIQKDEFRRFVLMKTGQDQRLLAIEVTSILDVEDMVIKPLHNTLNSSSYYRGVTFMDDGGVGLILNTAGIMDALQIRGKTKVTNNKTSTNNINSNTSENSKEHQTVLLVHLNEIGTFALSQSYIFRIEEIDKILIKQSGNSQVISYRNSALQVRYLSQFLSSKTRSVATAEKLQLVVVKNNETYLGLIVDQVIDMSNFDEITKELAQENHGIEAHLFFGKKTVPLLNIDYITSNAFRANNLENVVPISNTNKKEPAVAA